MPVYQFKCKECDIIFEETHTMKDAPSESSCPKCEHNSKRYYGEVNFALKGGDWPGKFIKDGGNRPMTQLSPQEIIATREKKGLSAISNKKLSEKEVAKRKKNIQDWADKIE